MGRLPTGVLLLSCLLLLLLQSPCEAVQCLVDDDTCQASNSCTIADKAYCCATGHVVRAVSMNDVLVSCVCEVESGSNTGYRCTVRSDEGESEASFTSASWLTCALTVLFALMSF